MRILENLQSIPEVVNIYLTVPSGCLASFSSSDPRLMKGGSWNNGGEEERQKGVCPLFVLCVVLRRAADEVERKRNCWITRALQTVLNCHTHAQQPAHTHFLYIHVDAHTWEHTFMHSSNVRTSGPIRSCMQANQGLSTERKQRVRRGEMFVMEIWTAGVRKQSSRQDAPETAYFTYEIRHIEELQKKIGSQSPSHSC